MATTQDYDNLQAMALDEYGLTHQQFNFAWYYAEQNFSDAKKAALRAGYSESSAAIATHLVLKNKKVASFLRQLVRDHVMDENEVKWRLSRLATASLEHFISFEIDAETGNERPVIDLKKGQESGMLFLVKKWKVTKQGEEIEMHDPLKALELLTKVLGMQVQKHVLEDWREKAEEHGITSDQAIVVYNQAKDAARKILEGQNVAQLADGDDKPKRLQG